jgi:hypothetical protein
LLLASIPFASQATEWDSQVSRWNFDVYLNDKRVGQHEFTVSLADDVKQVQSDANFDYKILFFSAYRYQHSAAERWVGDCLTELDADTDANGDRTSVSGEMSESGFVINKGGASVELPDCVMTFAYWNPGFLNQTRLLNPQTGEYVDVLVEEIGDDTVEVQGRSMAATRFRVRADEVDLTLWYSDDDQWLALESIAKGGHVIRYELS